MTINRPYRRTCRQLNDGSYGDSGHWQYLLHPAFAKSPEHYIRAFFLLQEDLEKLFDYVEPAEQNLSCYSYRIHELLLRACVEVDANLKAILLENGYVRSGDLRMTDYVKVEQSHRLSEYQVRLPTWHGNGALRTPFSAWSSGSPLSWYQAYNKTKHDRHSAFASATFEHMLDAVCGCLVVLSSQFWNHDFSSAAWGLSVGGPGDGMEEAIGGRFRIKFPDSWASEDRYDFNWQQLRSEPDPFQNYPYPQ